MIDEPSANLSPKQRIVAARVIKRFIQRSNNTAFVVEHDSAMVEHLADKVIVFEGTPSVNCVAHAPQPWNLFLAVRLNSSLIIQLRYYLVFQKFIYKHAMKIEKPSRQLKILFYGVQIRDVSVLFFWTNMFVF